MAKFGEAVCPACKKKFTRNRKGQVYCTSRCRFQHHNHANKELRDAYRDWRRNTTP